MTEFSVHWLLMRMQFEKAVRPSILIVYLFHVSDSVAAPLHCVIFGGAVEAKRRIRCYYCTAKMLIVLLQQMHFLINEEIEPKLQLYIFFKKKLNFQMF